MRTLNNCGGLVIAAALTALSALCLPSCEKAPEDDAPFISASVDRDRITVGDRITYRVRAAVEAKTPFVLQEYRGKIGPFTILESSINESEENGRSVVDHRYVITAFSTGLYATEPAVLKYREEGNSQLSSSPMEIEVCSVLGEAPELKDIMAPVGLAGEGRLRSYALIGLAAAAVAFLLVFLYVRRGRRARGPAEEAVVPPHEMAYRELEIIRSLRLLEKGMLKEYYTRICDVLRRYVEAAFGISAPEMTTEEFLVAAAASGGLREGHRDLLRDFLHQCDLVKFARYRATREEAESIYDAAKRFVDETAPTSTDQNAGVSGENEDVEQGIEGEKNVGKMTKSETRMTNK